MKKEGALTAMEYVDYCSCIRVTILMDQSLKEYYGKFKDLYHIIEMSPATSNAYILKYLKELQKLGDVELSKDPYELTCQFQTYLSQKKYSE